MLSRVMHFEIPIDDPDRASLTEALAKVRAAGGEPLTDKRAIPGIGWMAWFRDTEGNVVGLLQEDSLAGPDEGDLTG